MFGFGRKQGGNFGRGNGNCQRRQTVDSGRPGCINGERQYRNCISLADAIENRRYIVRQNPDKQTIEMGIAPSSMVFVHKNDIKEANIIVGVGETRLIIPRRSAELIKVR